MKLTLTDKKILRELLADSRMPGSKIAKKCGIPRQNVHNHIKRLQEIGLISQFSTKLDFSKLLEITGHSPRAWMKCYILVNTEEAKFRQDAHKKIICLPQVTQVHFLLGRYDVLIEAVVQNKEALSSLIMQLQELAKEYKLRLDTETFIAYQTLKEDPAANYLPFLK